MNDRPEPVFVRNAWYVAAWSAEVGRSLLSRRILGEPVVMFRKGKRHAGRLRRPLSA